MDRGLARWVPRVDDEGGGVLTRAELFPGLGEVLADELFATRLRCVGCFDWVVVRLCVGRRLNLKTFDDGGRGGHVRVGGARVYVALTSTCSSVSLYLSRSRDVESQPGRWSSNTTGGLVLTRYSGCDRIRSPGFGTFIAPDAVSDATPSLRACDLDYVECGRFGNEHARPCAKTASSPVSGWRSRLTAHF